MAKINLSALSAKAASKAVSKAVSTPVAPVSKPVSTTTTSVAPELSPMEKARLAYAKMTPGQKAKFSKELKAAGLPAFTVPSAALTFTADSDYSKMNAGQKAAYTKWRIANGLASAKPQPVSLLAQFGIVPNKA